MTQYTMPTTATLEIVRRPAGEITADGLRIFNDPAVRSVEYRASAVDFISRQIAAAGLQGYFSWQSPC